MIEIHNFTPYSALLGGVLIGLASAILILGIGRVAGISGISANAFMSNVSKQQLSWQRIFMLGLFSSAWIYGVFWGGPDVQLSDNYLLLIVAGLLVGFGTRLGSGCTSGHGVCGLSRLSPRSLVATLTFMTAGFVTVYLVKHLLAIA